MSVRKLPSASRGNYGLLVTGVNQQKFYFTLEGNTVSAKVNGRGFYARMDLGIVKYHFEAVTGRKVM